MKKMQTQTQHSKSILSQFQMMLSKELTQSARGLAPKGYVKPKTHSAHPKTRDADIGFGLK